MITNTKQFGALIQISNRYIYADMIEPIVPMLITSKTIGEILRKKYILYYCHKLALNMSKLDKGLD
jgi:hypothetical protein